MTQLDLQQRLEQTETERDALQQQVNALVAENLALLHQTPDVRSISMWEAIDKVEKLMDDGMPELAMVEAFEILKMKRVPATDAIKRQWMAEGAMKVADHPGIQLACLTHAVTEIAAQLRQSEEKDHD